MNRGKWLLLERINQTGPQMKDDCPTIRAMKLTTPLGPVILGENNQGLSHVWLGPEVFFDPLQGVESPLLLKAAAQLLDYFQGRRPCFDIPLAPEGTPFQQEVWAALLNIPYGETRTYGQVAKIVGRPRASRAVGQACHRNPLSIFIACHRVTGAKGALTGYAGGLEIKKYLLELESGFNGSRGLWNTFRAE